MSRSVERGTRALIFISKQTGCGLLRRRPGFAELELMDRGRGSLGHPGLGPATASGRGSRTGKISLRPAAAGHGHGHGHSIMVKFRRSLGLGRGVGAWALESDSMNISERARCSVHAPSRRYSTYSSWHGRSLRGY